MHSTDAQERERSFAKLFTVDGRQVIAYLNRDENDALTVILQLWIAASDEQLRAAIQSSSDELTQAIFDALDDEGIVRVMNEIHFDWSPEGATNNG